MCIYIQKNNLDFAGIILYTIYIPLFYILKVKLLSNVAYVEEETYAAGAQTPARCSANSWGRDRLDQTSSTLDCRYDPIHNGEGSDIYILDSGKRIFIDLMVTVSYPHL